ncbi:glycogen/starch synthase [Brucepastera parasyntrophica]|uniref:glycogen synthase n=1 Tax=Brucepastera parasyntrophica TaxID=2880008 RepID=UPI00210C83BA|nr:glycogen/starch synthase [Brucepastera parasyntrophica]ULQ59980.1 glycogen/starch synthase [Brucepastera parasyntrophica]
MSQQIEKIWLVTREYAGIAEAGGVKNVACSLAEGLVSQKENVTVFIPRYGSVSLSSNPLFSGEVRINDRTYPVSFSETILHGVDIIFIESPIFAEKHDVYVYTEEEVGVIPGAVRGKGHSDVHTMNMLFQKAVLEYARIRGTAPDILHGQDAHTAFLPALIRTESGYSDIFSKTASAVTIHNAGPGYRQEISGGLSCASSITGFPESILQKAMLNGNIEPFLLAAEYGTLTTVSPWYADELTSRSFDDITQGLSGELERRGIRITGITNGIDFYRYDPVDIINSLLPVQFNPESGDLAGKYKCRERFLWALDALSSIPTIKTYGNMEYDPGAVYCVYHGRLAWQKGIDVLERSARMVLDTLAESRFVVLGQGDPGLEDMLTQTASEYPGRFLFMNGYERSLARLVVAAADFIILPSLFEPCGLEDYIGQIYGTLPIAHAVGGLQKILDGQNGFLYRTQSPEEHPYILAETILNVCRPVVKAGGEGCAALTEYRKMIAFASDYVRRYCNWDTIISEKYIPLYKEIYKKNEAKSPEVYIAK